MLWRFFLQRIPDKFVQKFGMDLSDMAFLTIPNGRKWKVKLTQHVGGVWFQNGWSEFVSSHGVAVGHLLVFKYEGNSHFDVLFFRLNYFLNICYCSLYRVYPKTLSTTYREKGLPRTTPKQVYSLSSSRLWTDYGL